MASTASTELRQRGFTLVELMIALVVGLLLLTGVLQILLSNRASFEAQSATAHLQENARLAEFVLSHAIAHAGYRTALEGTAAGVFLASPGTTPNYPRGAYITGKANTNGHSDTLRLRFQAQGGVRDCRGTEVGSPGTPPQTVDFEFYVNDNDSLICHVFPGDYRTLVENVDRFEVRYGLDTDSTPGVDRYVSDLSGHDAANVHSVRVQLLLRSDDNDPALSHPIKQHYGFSDGSPFNATDRHARLLVDRTVAIRNPSP